VAAGEELALEGGQIAALPVATGDNEK